MAINLSAWAASKLKGLKDKFAPAENLRLRDVVRELPGAYNQVNKSVSDFAYNNVVKPAASAAVGFGDVALRTSPIETAINATSGIRNVFNAPKSSSVLDRYKQGVLNSQSRPLMWEQFNNNSVTKPTGGIYWKEGRKFVAETASAPTYLYSGIKGAALNPAGNLFKRVLTRTAASIPEAGINTGIQSFGAGENPLNNPLGTVKNFAGNVVAMGAFSNLGELKGIPVALRGKAKNSFDNWIDTPNSFKNEIPFQEVVDRTLLKSPEFKKNANSMKLAELATHANRLFETVNNFIGNSPDVNERGQFIQLAGKLKATNKTELSSAINEARSLIYDTYFENWYKKAKQGGFARLDLGLSKEAAGNVAPKGTPVFRGSVGEGEINAIKNGTAQYSTPDAGGLGGMWAKTQGEAKKYSEGWSTLVGSNTKKPVGTGKYIIEGKQLPDGTIIPIKATETKTGKVVDFTNLQKPLTSKSQTLPPKLQQPVLPEVKGGLNQVPLESSLPQSVPSKGGKVKVRGLVTSAQDASLAGETKAGISGSYVPKTNDILMGEAKSMLNEGGVISLKGVKDADKKVAATIQEALNLDKLGTPEGHQAAANMLNNLSEMATELGRGVNALSMLDKMSPEAIGLSAAGKIKKYNLTATRKIPELSGEQQQMISDSVANIQNLSGRDKNIAIQELSNKISDFIPSSLADKVITVWKAGLLTSLRTHERNLVGNTIMSVSEIAKDPIASIADRLMQLKTGKRTITATLRGTVGGTKKGLQAMKDVIKLGYDPNETIAKFDIKRTNFGTSPVGKFLKTATDAVYRPLSGEDKVFWHSSYARSLYDQAGAAAKNAGNTTKAFIENLVNNPTEEMLTNAFKDANYVTFKDKNVLSNVANAIKRTAQSKEYLGNAGAEVGKVVTEILAPFTGVPSSIAGKTIAYSPIGLIKGSIDVGRVISGSEVPELQRKAAQEIGRGIVGTGLFGLGAYLMSKGLMTGQPKDAAEARQWQLENKPYNSVLINGKWRAINSVGPQSLVLLSGAKLQEEMAKPDGSLAAYAAGVGKDQLGQTFLQGVQGPLQAITDPNRYGKSYIGNQMSSVVPNIVKDTSKALDSNQREYNSSLDYVKASIPGLRNTMLPKRDASGNIMPQEPTGFGAFVDLFNSKTPSNDPIVKELSRLNAEGNNATPSKIESSQTILGEKINLTPQELDNLEAQSGGAVRESLGQLISSPEYVGLSDEDKKKLIGDTVTDIRKETMLNISAGKPTSSSSGVLRYISDGKEVQVDYGKVSAMPETTNYEKILKEKEAWKIAVRIDETSLSSEKKQEIYDTLGLDSSKVEYNTIASKDNDIKTAYLTDQLATIDPAKKIEALSTLRQTVNGEKILADGVVDNLYNEGVITSSERKYLKSIKDYNPSTKTSQLKAGSGGAKKLKAAQKITFAKIKVSTPKRASIKKLKAPSVKGIIKPVKRQLKSSLPKTQTIQQVRSKLMAKR